MACFLRAVELVASADFLNVLLAGRIEAEQQAKK